MADEKKAPETEREPSLWESLAVVERYEDAWASLVASEAARQLEEKIMADGEEP